MSRTTTVQSVLVIAILAIGGAAFYTTHDSENRAAGDGSASPLAERRSELAAALLHASDTLYVTPSSGPDAALVEARFEEMLEHLTGAAAEDRVVPADRVDARTLAERPVVLIGTPATNPRVEEALARLPIEIFEHTVRVFDDASRIGVPTTRFDGAARYLNLAVRGINPWNSDHGLVVMTGTSDRTIADHAFHPDLGENDYVVRLRDLTMRSGRFGATPATALEPDPTSDFNRFAGARSDFERSLALRKVQRAGRGGSTDDPIYGISIPRDEPKTRAIMTALTERASALRRASERLVSGMEEPRLRVYVYPDRETKAEETGDFSAVHASASAKQVHLVFDDRFDPRDTSPEMRIAVYDLYPSLTLRAIREGLAVAAADRYGGKPLALSAARLLKAGVLPGVEDLLDDDAFARLAPALASPAAGSFVAWTIAGSAPKPDGRPALDRVLRIGHLPDDGPPAPEAVARVYGQSLAEAQDAWHAWIGERAAATRFVPPIRSEDPRAVEPPSLEFEGSRLDSRIAGARLVHSFRIATGLGSAELDSVLDELRERTGAQWISIRPSATLEIDGDGVRLVDFPPASDRRAAWMPRGAVESCIEVAHRAGFGVLLAPELRYGGEALSVEGDAGWEDFFDIYTQWCLEWADVAQRYDVELLGLGRGLGVTATGRLREWNRLVRDVRGLYDGRLTYLASTPEEIQGARHWAFVDVISVDLALDAAAGADLDRSAASAVRALVERGDVLARRYRKPVIVTGLGGAGGDSGPIPGARAALLRAVRSGLEARPWFGGAFAVDWSTAPRWNREPVHGRPPALGTECIERAAAWYRTFE